MDEIPRGKRGAGERHPLVIDRRVDEHARTIQNRSVKNRAAGNGARSTQRPQSSSAPSDGAETNEIGPSEAGFHGVAGESVAAPTFLYASMRSDIS
jgi:hypothetical protein